MIFNFKKDLEFLTKKAAMMPHADITAESVTRWIS